MHKITMIGPSYASRKIRKNGTVSLLLASERLSMREIAMADRIYPSRKVRKRGNKQTVAGIRSGCQCAVIAAPHLPAVGAEARKQPNCCWNTERCQCQDHVA